MHDGDSIPAGSLVSSDGGLITLSALTDRPLVLYFYPKADTPGCTIEAKDFSRLNPAFAKVGVAVV
ncbi:MAG: redoxin domain-containing protein, partial [Sphingopyxis sp.]